MLWIKEVAMIDSLEELKSSRSVSGKNFTKFWDAGPEDWLCSEHDHPEFPVQEKGQSRGTESPERESVSTRKTDRLHDLRLLSSNWRSWHRIGLCWFILSHSPGWQHSGIRYEMGRSSIIDDKKIPSNDILESLYKLRIRVSAQLKTVLDLYEMEIHLKISMPNYQKLKTMVKRRIDPKLRLRNFDATHRKIETGAMEKSRKGPIGVEGGKGIYMSPVESKRPVFEGRPVQFPPRNPRSCAKTRTHCRHSFRAINDTRSKCVEEKQCQQK